MNPASPPIPGADPLEQLRDIHLPDAVATWVMTPGWWLVLVIVVVLLTWLGMRYYRHQQQVAYRRIAISRLQALVLSLNEHPLNEHRDTSLFLQQLTTLMKQVCLTSFPRTRVASLTGVAWVAFLDETGETSEFSMGAGQALIDGGYRPECHVDAQTLTVLCENWIRHHRDSEGRQLSFIKRPFTTHPFIARPFVRHPGSVNERAGAS